MGDGARAAGRLDGIREAIAIAAGWDMPGYVAALEALLQPPSGGEQAKCTTCGATDPLATPTCSNGFHAPKPAAEKA